MAEGKRDSRIEEIKERLGLPIVFEKGYQPSDFPHVTPAWAVYMAICRTQWVYVIQCADLPALQEGAR